MLTTLQFVFSPSRIAAVDNFRALNGSIVQQAKITVKQKVINSDDSIGGDEIFA